MMDSHVMLQIFMCHVLFCHFISHFFSSIHIKEVTGESDTTDATDHCVISNFVGYEAHNKIQRSTDDYDHDEDDVIPGVFVWFCEF